MRIVAIAALCLAVMSCVATGKRPVPGVEFPEITQVGPLRVTVAAVVTQGPFGFVIGTAENTSSEPLGFSGVLVPVIAASGVKIGDALVQVTSLDPGQAMKFESLVSLGTFTRLDIAKVGTPRDITVGRQVR